jgi:hypothetical protein
MAACRDVLGLAEVPVRVMDIPLPIRGEAEENAQRLGFSPEEGLEVYDAVLEEERRLAKSRQKAGLRRGREKAPAEEAPVQGNSLNGAGVQSRDLAAAVTGYSEKSLRMARFVVEHAKAEPDIFDDIRQEMNRTRNIARAVSAIRRVLRERALCKQRAAGAGSVQLHRMDAVEFLHNIVEPACADLLLTDPPYMTDVEDIWSFAEWVEHGLRVLKPSGRFYIFTGAYRSRHDLAGKVWLGRPV